MNRIFPAFKYLNYLINAKNAHHIHSPFVFELYKNVFHDKTPFYGFELIESLRARHLLNKQKIFIEDYGTGRKNRHQSICDIVKKSVKPKKYSQLLFRLANSFSSENILELGTSLGITSLYLSYPNKKSRVITLEGSPEIASLAQQNFNLLKRDNIELICGEFSQTLPQSLQKFTHLDMVYFDGNHRKNATLSYFQQCLNHINERSIFIFDDIHWNLEMENAWHEIKENKAVTLSIDLFQFGIVFFRNGIIKQHFTLR